MSEVIALLSDDGFEYYDTDGNKIEPAKLEKQKLYAILPDRFFFFFQTDINAKRRSLAAVEAFARSTFPVENGFVGHLKGYTPLIGYIYLKEKETDQIADIIRIATVVTSPFAIYLESFKNRSFIYKSSDICAVYSEKVLISYTPGDCQKDQIEKPEDYENIEYSQDELFKLLKRLIAEKRIRDVALATSKRSSIGEWKVHRFILLAIAALAFIAGGILRYSAYQKELKTQRARLENLYKKALGGKKYADPYGVLLYKAKSASYSASITPTKLLFALSKAKNGYDIVVDYISYSNGEARINGKASNYATLVGYVDTLNRILNGKVSIQNTSSYKGKLKFTLHLKGSS